MRSSRRWRRCLPKVGSGSLCRAGKRTGPAGPSASLENADRQKSAGDLRGGMSVDACSDSGRLSRANIAAVYGRQSTPSQSIEQGSLGTTGASTRQAFGADKGPYGRLFSFHNIEAQNQYIRPMMAIPAQNAQLASRRENERAQAQISERVIEASKEKAMTSKGDPFHLGIK